MNWLFTNVFIYKLKQMTFIISLINNILDHQSSL